MTNEEEVILALKELKDWKGLPYCIEEPMQNEGIAVITKEALDMAIRALEQPPIDKSAMMYEIYMKGVNMTGEYQGCWVRFKDIEKIVDKYMAESE